MWWHSASSLTDSSGQLWQRKQRPIHVRYVCCTCWFGLFCLCFLLVGHTHEDIDQKFNVIFGTFKRQDIDSMQQLLDLVKEGTSPTQTYKISRHLEYIWDWKKFITTYLFICLYAFVEISKPHHFKFYLKNNKSFVQTKNYARDSKWEHANGY